MFSGPARRFGMAWMFLALLTTPALAEGRRVALVIGNNAYTAEAALENAVRDADLVAGAFRRLGFAVTTYHDLDNRALRTALRSFAATADGAEVAALYFAGHGIAVDGRNWLLPVDARLADVRDLDDEAVPDSRLTAAVDGARGLQLVILDACRNNPFTPRMAGRAFGRQVRGRGLEPIGEQDLPPNRLIAFAARDGQVAQDGPAGSNGPYAVALAQRLVQPGVEVGILFRRVRDDVAGQTRSAQVPWTYSNLGGQELYLAGATVVPVPEPVRPLPPPPPPLPAGGYPVAVGGSFRDCNDGTCPEMVVIPAGRFLMGSPASEAGRGSDEGPQHEVVVKAPLAVGRTHVTVGEYRAFVAATGRADGPSCWVWTAEGKGEDKPGRNWRNPGFSQTERDPVVCVSWDDAQAYARWLSARTGRGYRLPTEAEWEYAARAGTQTRWWWGEDEAAQCRFANGADQTAREKVPGTNGWTFAACRDGFAYTSPVGSFEANGFGLKDMAGNAWQWVADCYRNDYAGAPSDASATVIDNNCSARVLRGGSWLNSPRGLRSALRSRLAPGYRDDDSGFRLARTPGP